MKLLSMIGKPACRENMAMVFAGSLFLSQTGPQGATPLVDKPYKGTIYLRCEPTTPDTAY